MEQPLVFICHASEDKDGFVRPLAEAMRNSGIRVFYDEFSLTPGSSLRQSIESGLALCRYAVVVLSEAFFAKKWTQWELNGLVQRQFNSTSNDIIIPIWLGVDAAIVSIYSPPLADILAYEADRGVTGFVQFMHDLCYPNRQERSVGVLQSIAFLAHSSLDGIVGADKAVYSCDVWRYDDSGSYPDLVREASTGPGPESKGMDRSRRISIGSSLTGLVFSTQKSLSVDDLSSWSSSQYCNFNTKWAASYAAFAAVPILTSSLMSGGGSIGVVSASFTHEMGEEELRRKIISQLEAVARICSHVL